MADSKLANWSAARRDGEMSPFTVAKVFALEKQWVKDNGDKTYGKWMWISGQVKVQGGGSPKPAAVLKLVAKMEKADDWHPGKIYGERPGRKG